jgi:Zn-dependent protease with chaperone function
MSAPRAWSARALGGVSGESLATLALALCCEAAALALPIRTGLIWVGGEVLAPLAGVHGGAWVLWVSLLAPVAWPAIALLEPFPSGWWWRQAQGGRAPSERERLAYEDSVTALGWEARGELRLPRDWFVLDTLELTAGLHGDTLMLSRGLLASEHLTAVLAHELGHLASGDGRLAAAIGRLTIGGGASGRDAAGAPAFVWPSPPRLIGRTALSEATIWALWLARCACSLTWQLAKGSIGLRLLGPSFDREWQAREHEADAFAARLGQGEQLADCLEEHVLIHDGPAPFLWRRRSAHPPTELRIDRLRGVSGAGTR